MITKRLLAGTLLGTALVATGSCGQKPLPYGDPNSIIAVMSREQWEAVSQDVYDALEQTIATVRSEKTFTVTYQEPYAEFWDRLRRFRQMLVVGSRSDSWVQEVLDEARDPITENGIHQVFDVWSRGQPRQTVTLVLLDEGWGASDLAAYLPDVNRLLDGQYRAYARNRMYFSGVDSALADTLATEAGFLMYLPLVYRWRRLDSVYVFRNDNPDPSELIRQVAVTWLTPAPGRLDTEGVLEWRARIAEEIYSVPQEILVDGLDTRAFDFEGHEAFELRAQWRNPPDWQWPAGGPVITRTVTCDSQDRTYLLDAWLYAPAKEKYEYMIQLETLLDTFRCTS
jgi:uncharacterized protein DUF4837